VAVLKYYNTATSAWEYIAASTTANFTTWKKTMAGGETSVSGTDDNGVTLSYTVGLEQVFINGALQVRGSDYVATTGTTVTGLSALGANDIVSVVCYAPFNVANTYTQAQTDDIAAAAPGMRLIVPSSISVGSGSGSVDANGAITFSGASSIAINNVFSSTYNNYYITGNLSITGGDVAMRWRTSSGDDSNSTYSYGLARKDFGGATFTNDTQSTTATSYGVAIANPGTTQSGFWQYVNNPFATARTSAYGLNISSSGYAYYTTHQFTNTTSFTGLSLIPTSTYTTTGTVRIYGFKN
jgi:hypothetical protein